MRYQHVIVQKKKKKLIILYYFFLLTLYFKLLICDFSFYFITFFPFIIFPLSSFFTFLSSRINMNHRIENKYVKTNWPNTTFLADALTNFGPTFYFWNIFKLEKKLCKKIQPITICFDNGLTNFAPTFKKNLKKIITQFVDQWWLFQFMI